MKEAFDLIRKRIEEIWVDNRCGDCVHKSVCDKVQEEAIVNDQTDLCGVTIKAVALSIVSEVEAEYGNTSTEYINKSSDCSTNWIPVEERLPEEKGEYLVTFHPCYWDNVQYDKIFVWIDTFRGKTTWAKKKYQRVLAWMPLPLPYKPEKERN